MSGFTAEYLARIEEGMKLMADANQYLEAGEQMLNQEPTAATIKEMVQQLGLCAASVSECQDCDAIMPHDTDELMERYLMLAMLARTWVKGNETDTEN